VSENGDPTFSFTLAVQEIDCRVKKSTKEIKEGSPNTVTNNTYIIEIKAHENPDLAEVGHPYVINSISLVGSHPQLF
jgi:hypothetical protein